MTLPLLVRTYPREMSWTILWIDLRRWKTRTDGMTLLFTQVSVHICSAFAVSMKGQRFDCFILACFENQTGRREEWKLLYVSWIG